MTINAVSEHHGKGLFMEKNSKDSQNEGIHKKYTVSNDKI